jgi:O-antigen/teichoic acid export membrane protein
MVTRQKKMRIGMIWLTGGQIWGRGFSMVAGVLLARLLSPEDYGMRAMAATFSNLVSLLGTLGVAQMLIQQQEEFDKYANAGFRMNIGVGLCLFFLQVAVAPFAGQFYENSTVTKIIMVSALGYLIWPVGSVHTAILTKQMNFKRKVIPQIVTAVLSPALSVAFAVQGFGVWSFIIPSLIVAPIEVGMYWYLVPWRPSKGFMMEYWSPIFRYGRNIMGVNALSYLRSNMSYLLIGKFLSSKTLGLYTLAFEASAGLLANFLNISGTVFFSALSEAKKDPIQLKKEFFQYATILSLVFTPVIFLLIGTGPEFITGIYGGKWSKAVIPFILLAGSTIFTPIGNLCFQLANAVGRPDLNMRWNLIATPLLILTLAMTIRYGIIGVAAATAGYYLVAGPIWIGLCFRMLGWEYRLFIRSITPAFEAASVMLFGLFLIRVTALNALFLPVLVKLFLLTLIGSGLYLGVLRCFFPDEFRKLFLFIVNFLIQPIRSVFSRKGPAALKTH